MRKALCLIVATLLLLCTLPAGCPVNDTSTIGDGNNTPGARALTGTINASESAKRSPRMQEQEQHYAVVVQSVDTQEVYVGEADAAGNFQVDIPATETGEVFMVNVMMPDGQPAGPIVFGQDANQGYTGVTLDDDVDLGDIPFPDDPTLAPIVPGDDADYDPNGVPDNIIARLNDDGVPVGVPEFGRGDDAEGDKSDDDDQQLDADQDGMIDLFDADDDGDGVVDDFDDDAVLNPGMDGLILNFFMNLKIDDEQATAFFTGDLAGIEDCLKNNTVITFEINGTGLSTKNITSCRVIGPPAPAPAYMPLMTVLGGTSWSATTYDIPIYATNHHQEWATPHDFMSTGDTFMVEVLFDDGTVGVYSRMINYVFKSIPKLINIGPPGALAVYSGPGVVQFDGTRDLTLEWAPPVDDFGNLIVGIPYSIEVFYNDTAGQQIQNLDFAATWPTAITNWGPQSPTYNVDASAVTTLSAINTFTVTLPKEFFPDTVELAGGTLVDVGSYKIDIAAQRNGNNAALMFRLEKQ
ncbi:MAG: hypothetical protein ABIG44_18340 [Planctomycetota bacterium]